MNNTRPLIMKMQSILGNGRMEIVMDSGNRSGEMALFTRVNGRITKPMEREGSSMLMVMFMKEIGLTIEPMDMACILFMMEHNM